MVTEDGKIISQKNNIPSIVILKNVRVQVLMASIKMTAFWDIAPCSLVEVDQLMMEAVCTSEMPVYFHETTHTRKLLS
jgi:hypothetical protein